MLNQGYIFRRVGITHTSNKRMGARSHCYPLALKPLPAGADHIPVPLGGGPVKQEPFVSWSLIHRADMYCDSEHGDSPRIRGHTVVQGHRKSLADLEKKHNTDRVLCPGVSTAAPEMSPLSPHHGFSSDLLGSYWLQPQVWVTWPPRRSAQFPGV